MCLNHLAKTLIYLLTNNWVTDGAKTPRNSYKKIEIDEGVSQDWKGNPQPYYPPIPRINKFGLFSDVVDENKFYGSKTTWDPSTGW